MNISAVVKVDSKGNAVTSWGQHTPGWQSFTDGVRHVFAANTEDGYFDYAPPADLELWSGDINIDGARDGDFIHIDLIDTVGVTPVDPNDPEGAKVPAGTAIYRFVNGVPIDGATSEISFPRPDRSIKLPSTFHLRVTLEAQDATNNNTVTVRGKLYAFKHPVSGGTWEA